ncbi:flagellin N-methylase [mine drainage metagenome]|uniref:Flagellin N-methylase n=1 Tax=mine drainage metagenome TaxID=410659 RepID=A0A1J5TAF3_9ZZZZ
MQNHNQESSQNNDQENSPLAFFGAMHSAFSGVITQRQNVIEGLLSIAFSSFDGNVEIQAESQPKVDCSQGCAACCRLRVVASAPEVLLIAKYIRAKSAHFQQHGIDLTQRVAEADADTRGLSEAERAQRKRRCPFIFKGACTIYPVRTLACRGHASHDKRACAGALAGDDGVIPISQPHLMVRSIVQNSMQSALLDHGYAWGLYELNHALHLALTDEEIETRWLNGEDVFSPATINEVQWQEMANTFDAIKARLH